MRMDKNIYDERSDETMASWSGFDDAPIYFLLPDFYEHMPSAAYRLTFMALDFVYYIAAAASFVRGNKLFVGGGVLFGVRQQGLRHALR